MATRVAGDVPVLGFVGAGRAGSALAHAFTAAGCRVAAVASRTPSHAKRLADAVGAEHVPTAAAVAARADMVLLTVPDDAIAEVAAAIPDATGRGVVHCSARLGTEPLAAVVAAGGRAGVLHPLQAMAGAESAALLREAYFRVEARTPLRRQLERLVASLDGHVLRIAPRDRDLYHAAAVLAGNAPLALLAWATELLEQAGVSSRDAHAALSRLLEGAAVNARGLPPDRALTGPVVRGDAAAVAAHLTALEPYPDAHALYAQLVAEMERLLSRRSRRGAPLHRVA